MSDNISASDALQDILEKQRQAFRKEGPVKYETRVDRLDRCIALLVDRKDQICEAVDQDFGGRPRPVTLMTEIMTSVGSLKNARKNLKKWMAPQKRKSPIPMNLFGAKSRVHYQPKGVVGIMTPWNVPVGMIFSPIADALAAGNRIMIKPSEFNPRTAELMKELFMEYFEPSEIYVATGGAEVGAAFSQLPLDHLLFTGATSIGKLVMKAAAENLTPVTLELGGKSPVIVSDSYPIDQAAESIISGKAMNGGQLCISPDYAFVPAARLEAFIVKCKEVMEDQYPKMVGCHDFVSIINERHFDRIKSYIDDAKKKGARILEINPSKENWSDRNKHRIPLHLIINPTEDMLCMQDEIFGPILNIISYREMDECLNYINDHPHPLALYYYGKDKAETARVIAETTSGGMCVNEVTMHFACDDMPFGGVGASGMGHYHGFEGFKTFSHAKSVFTQGKVNLPKLAGTLPPYGEKIEKMLLGQIKK